MMTLGEKIKACRQAAGMSQEKVAELVGVSRQAVTKWEANQSAPNTENLFKLAEILGTTVDFLLTSRKLKAPGRTNFLSLQNGGRKESKSPPGQTAVKPAPYPSRHRWIPFHLSGRTYFHNNRITDERNRMAVWD